MNANGIKNQWITVFDFRRGHREKQKGIEAVYFYSSSIDDKHCTHSLSSMRIWINYDGVSFTIMIHNVMGYACLLLIHMAQNSHMLYSSIINKCLHILVY